MLKVKYDWTQLDPRIDQLKAQGLNDTDIARTLDIKRQTLVDYLRSRASTGAPAEHFGTPEHQGTREGHLGTPEHFGTPAHLGTLEAHQEVLEDVQASVPDAPHVGAAAIAQGLPEHPSAPEVHPELSPIDSGVSAEHLGTPEVRQELSPIDLGVPVGHSGIPARQGMAAGVSVEHPSTPEDWELWITIKSRWGEVEKLLAERQALLSTLTGIPGHTRKKTYVFDERHIALIERYAAGHRLELKDVIYQVLEEFFQRRGSIDADNAGQ